jgi:hypothetical protein
MMDREEAGALSVMMSAIITIPSFKGINGQNLTVLTDRLNKTNTLFLQQIAFGASQTIYG